MGARKSLKEQALGGAQKAVEKLMADEKRAMAIASALGSVQRGKQALDRGQEELMRALNFAPRGDYKAVGKKLSGLKRRLRELDAKLDEISRESR
jgi:hypothetical protein